MIPAAVVAVGLLWTAVQNEDRERRIGDPETPLVFLLSPDHGRNLSSVQITALANSLSAASNLSVKVVVASTPLDAIEAFDVGPGRADAGIINLFQYALARREYEVEAFLQTLRREGDSHYDGEILVRADAGVGALKDLAGRRIAFVDPFSTSGFVFPARLIGAAGIQVTPVFAGSHRAALEMLRKGDADAAAVYSGAAHGDSSLICIARTDSIPNEPVVFNRALREEKRAALAAAIMQLAYTQEGAAIFAGMADIKGFRPTTDASYNEVFSAIRAAGLSVYQTVPEGIKVESRRRNIDYLP